MRMRSRLAIGHNAGGSLMLQRGHMLADRRRRRSA